MACSVFCWEKEEEIEKREEEENGRKIYDGQELLLGRRKTTSGPAFLDAGHPSGQESPAHTPDLRLLPVPPQAFTVCPAKLPSTPHATLG